MATQLFFHGAVSDFGTGTNDANLRTTATGWGTRTLTTSRGASATSVGTTTVAGPTNGVEAGSGVGLPLVWYTPPLDADITISGSVTWNLRAAESANNSNSSVNGRIEVIDGATGTITLIDQTARTTELSTSEAAVNFSETPAAGVACKRGDRLRVRVYFDDAGSNMGSGFTDTFWYDGPTPAASGDSYVTLTENLTFVSEPAGSQVFPTDTASAVSTASVDREAWTSRGAGVQNDVTNTAAGWTAPIQITDTAGGTVVDWFTRQLAAFTLGGAVRVNARAKASLDTANAVMRCEVARVASDGTSPTVWGATTEGSGTTVDLTTTEVARSFLVSGDDLAISDGQRLRIRFYIDDPAGAAMAASQTVTLYYAGTSGGASGDTYLTFTQTLTEFSAGTTVTPTTAALVITKNIPTVTASNNQRVEPTTKALTSATFAPTIRLGQVVTVPTAGGAGYVAAVLADSPVGYWRMGEASGSVLDSIASSHGDATGTTRNVTGALTVAQDDGAITFNGTSDFITFYDVLDQTTTVTYELWLKRSSTTAANQYMMNKGGGQPNVVFRNTDNLIWVTDESVYLVASSVSIADTTTWHHVVFTHAGSASGDNKLYIDGADVTVQLNGATFAANSSWLRIGSGASSSYFPGSIDEAAIYNTVLSPTRVLAHYTAGITAGGLVLTTYAPTIRQGVGVIPTTKALTLSTFAPTVRTPILATPAIKAVVLTKYAPTVSTPVRATPAAVSLTATKYAPTIYLHQRVTPTTKALVATKYAPSVTTPERVIPTTKALVLEAFAPTVTAAAHQTVTPTTKALTLATFAPTVTAGASLTVTPITKALALSPNAPTVSTSNNQAVIPTTKALTLATFQVTVRTPILATPTTKALVLVPFVPVVSATAHLTVTPQAAALTVSEFAPTVSAGNNQVVIPAVKSLTATTFAPTVSATAHIAVIPTTKALTATRFAPTVAATAHQTLIPAAVSLQLNEQVPTVSFTAHQTITVPKASLTLTAYEPTTQPTDDKVVIPTTKTVTITKLTPTVTATANVAVTPTTKTVAITKFAPTITTPVRVTPTTKALVITKFAPQARAPILSTPQKKTLTLATFQTTVRTPVLATPQKATLTVTRFAPTVQAGANVEVVPNSATLALTKFAPTVSASADVAVVPTTKALTLTTYAPAARIAYRFTPTTKVLVLATFAPTVSATTNALVRPSTATLTITEQLAILEISGHLVLTPPALALNLTTYPPTAEQHSITPLPDFIYGFAVVAYGDSAGVGMENGGATVRSEGGGTAVSSSGPSARVTIR